MKKTIKFGIIGCGLMGREFASASARWCHLIGSDTIPHPEIVGICDPNPQAKEWFLRNFSSITTDVTDYHELLKREDIEAIYCAIPHNLHQNVYIDTICAGKHLLGEKPFGIDKTANTAILRAIDEHPEVIVRCSSEFPYFPACQQLIRWIQAGKLGKMIEVHTAFCHSSDMDLNKPINWKRMIAINGEYGCMGDLGIHTEHLPFRLGWIPKSVYAQLSKIVTQRPDGKGGMTECKTWDNATLICDTQDKDGGMFPVYYETKRLSPGSTNEWRIEAYGMDSSVKFSTNDPNAFYYTQNCEKEQAWCRLDVGNKPLFPTITGGIFEFGFADSILQMWAAFISEICGLPISFGCFTPEETRLSHDLHTAALLSHKTGRVQPLI